jgi:hypothetical protein
MNDELKTEFRRAMWSLVIAAVIAISGGFLQSYVMQQKMNDQIKIITKEQTLIRTKVDLMQLQLERKVDRNTLDNCLNRIDVKLDNINNNLLKLKFIQP